MVGLLYVRYGGVVVAGQSNAVFAAQRHKVLSVRHSMLGLYGFAVSELGLEFVFTPAFFTCVIDACRIYVFPLSLARCVVHQRN